MIPFTILEQFWIACWNKPLSGTLRFDFRSNIRSMFFWVYIFQTIATDEDIPWIHHPFGRKLVQSLITHYAEKSDLQMAAMLCCIFGKDIHNEEMNRKHSDISNVSIIFFFLEWRTQLQNFAVIINRICNNTAHWCIIKIKNIQIVRSYLRKVKY